MPAQALWPHRSWFQAGCVHPAHNACCQVPSSTSPTSAVICRGHYQQGGEFPVQGRNYELVGSGVFPDHGPEFRQ